MSQGDFQASTPYAEFGSKVFEAPADARVAFIRKTYLHLAAAIYAFVALEWLFFSLGWDEVMMRILGNSPYSWLIVLGMFMAVGWIANKWALTSTSLGMQYAGLFIYVLAEAIIFLPLLAIAQHYSLNPEQMGIEGMAPIPVIPAAAVITLIMFAGLTAIAFITKKDFSFLGGILGIAMIGAMAAIVASIVFGFSLGIWFSALMIVAACGYILYYTSSVMHHYRTDQYVAAALALFAAVALLFWYVVRILIALSGRD